MKNGRVRCTPCLGAFVHQKHLVLCSRVKRYCHILTYRQAVFVDQSTGDLRAFDNSARLQGWNISASLLWRGANLASIGSLAIRRLSLWVSLILLSSIINDFVFRLETFQPFPKLRSASRMVLPFPDHLHRQTKLFILQHLTCRIDSGGSGTKLFHQLMIIQPERLDIVGQILQYASI